MAVTGSPRPSTIAASATRNSVSSRLPPAQSLIISDIVLPMPVVTIALTTSPTETT